jgi:hypothetical protein
MKRLAGMAIHLPVVRDRFYMGFQWQGPFPVEVIRLADGRSPRERDATES